MFIFHIRLVMKQYVEGGSHFQLLSKSSLKSMRIIKDLYHSILLIIHQYKETYESN